MILAFACSSFPNNSSASSKLLPTQRNYLSHKLNLIFHPPSYCSHNNTKSNMQFRVLFVLMAAALPVLSMPQVLEANRYAPQSPSPPIPPTLPLTQRLVSSNLAPLTAVATSGAAKGAVSVPLHPSYHPPPLMGFHSKNHARGNQLTSSKQRLAYPHPTAAPAKDSLSLAARTAVEGRVYTLLLRSSPSVAVSRRIL